MTELFAVLLLWLGLLALDTLALLAYALNRRSDMRRANRGSMLEDTRLSRNNLQAAEYASYDRIHYSILQFWSLAWIPLIAVQFSLMDRNMSRKCESDYVWNINCLLASKFWRYLCYAIGVVGSCLLALAVGEANKYRKSITGPLATVGGVVKFLIHSQFCLQLSFLINTIFIFPQAFHINALDNAWLWLCMGTVLLSILLYQAGVCCWLFELACLTIQLRAVQNISTNRSDGDFIQMQE